MGKVRTIRIPATTAQIIGKISRLYDRISRKPIARQIRAERLLLQWWGIHQ
jgi:hypothetical protein